MSVPTNIPGGDMQIAEAQWQACSNCSEEIIPDGLSKAIERVRLQRLGLIAEH